MTHGEEATQATQEEEATNATQGEEDTNATQGEEDTNATQGEEDTNATQGEEDTNATQGEEDTNATQGEEDTNATQGEEDTNATHEAAEVLLELQTVVSSRRAVFGNEMFRDRCAMLGCRLSSQQDSFYCCEGHKDLAETMAKDNGRAFHYYASFGVDERNQLAWSAVLLKHQGIEVGIPTLKDFFKSVPWLQPSRFEMPHPRTSMEWWFFHQPPERLVYFQTGLFWKVDGRKNQFTWDGANRQTRTIRLRFQSKNPGIQHLRDQQGGSWTLYHHVYDRISLYCLCFTRDKVEVAVPMPKPKPADDDTDTDTEPKPKPADDATDTEKPAPKKRRNKASESSTSTTTQQVFGPSASQEAVFADTQPLIRSVLDCYNVCIFAFGQTGSGKTFTMMGPNERTEASLGVNYRALSDLFHLSSLRKETFSYKISVQMLEIYNEQVRDLLATNGQTSRLEIRNSSQDGINVLEATLVPVSTTSDVIYLMNDRSRRSHSCLTVHVQGRDLTSGATLRGSMHLVDVAGSERVDKSEVTGDRLREAQHINKSLSALGDLIASLSQKNNHIPYRNSKLTQLLQDALGGQAKTLMFIHISPEIDALGETLSTLKFSERVATVELGAARVNKDASEVKELKEETASLKLALARKESESDHKGFEVRKIPYEVEVNESDENATSDCSESNLMWQLNVQVNMPRAASNGSLGSSTKLKKSQTKTKSMVPSLIPSLGAISSRGQNFLKAQ